MFVVPFPEELIYVGIAVLAFIAAALIVISHKGPIGQSLRRIPKRFEVEAIGEDAIPKEAVLPLAFLAERLAKLGFVRASEPVAMTRTRDHSYRILIAPFCNEAESTLFVMGIESGPRVEAQLILHLITPLTGNRRVETTTVAGLEALIHPAQVELRVVVDAESVDEIWSRHRLALAERIRADRAPCRSEMWRELVAATYEAWVQSGVRSQRLMLDSHGDAYRIRARPKSMI